MFSFSPHLLELYPNFIEGFSDDSNEYILDHPSQEEDHGYKVEGRLPRIQTVSGSVHDVDPTLLGCSLVHCEHTGGKLSKPSEPNVKPASVGQVHASEPIPASESIRVAGITLAAAVGVGDGEVIDGDIVGTSDVGVVPIEDEDIRPPRFCSQHT